MNNIDIDTILISLVAILVVVVIARIAIQRYRMSHIKLPENVREAGSQTADSANAKKSINIANPPNENKVVQAQTETKEEQPETEADTKQDEAEISIEKVSPQENKNVAQNDDSKYELDYQELISNPVGILNNTELPARHRIAAIREIGYQKLSSAVPDLINALYDPDPSISLVAAESLGVIGDDRAIEPLLEISRKNDEELSKAAEEYIGGALVVTNEQPSTSFANQSEDETAPRNYKEMVVFKVEQLPLEYFQPDGSPIPRKELVVKGLNDNNEQMRQIAAKAAIGIEESEDIIDPLSKALENPLESEAIRSMAAEALGGMESDKSVSALINALKDDNVAVRYAAATALSGRSEPRVVEALIGATRDADKYVRASAAYALGTTRETVALKALINCAEDENEAVRFSAVKAISTYNFEDVIKRLVNPKATTEDRSKVLAKIEILSQFKDPRAIEILRDYLNDTDSEICYKASMALMGQENPELIDELVNASKRLDKELYRLAQENMAPEVFTEITKFNTDFNLNNSLNDENINKPTVAVSQVNETNGNIPPSRMENIQNAAEFVKAKNTKKKEAVLNIDPEDYSNDINFNVNEDTYIEESRRSGNKGFNNEELDRTNNPREEIVVNLDDYSNQEVYVEAPTENNTFFNDTSSVFGTQPAFNDEEIVAVEPIEQEYESIIDEDDLTLEQMTGFSPEFEKIRKKLLNDSPNVRGSAANTLGDYGSNPESIKLLRGALKDKNELVRVASINALGRIADMDALQLILTCEKDMSTEVRYAVVKALAEIPDYSASEALKRMASSDISIDVKRNARIALEKHN